jgi:hypothetical protein
MNDADIYGSPANYDALVEALKRRASELKISYADLDAIAGLPAGFAGKVFGPSQTKKFGALSLFSTLPALGLRFTLAVDPDALRRYAQRGARRNWRQARLNNLAQVCGKRNMQRALRHLALTCSWVEILKIVSAERAAVAAEQTVKAERKAAAEARRKAPRSSRAKTATAPAPPARSTSMTAYDAPMVSATAELAEMAEASSIYVSRKDGRGAKRHRVARYLPAMDMRSKIKRAEGASAAAKAKTAAVAR